MKPAAVLPLETITDEPLRFEFELPFEVAALDREPLLSISPAHVAGEISRVEGGYSLAARLRWSGQLECSRCLAPYDFANDEQFTLVLYPRKPVGAGEIALDRDDLDAFFYDDPVVSVSPIAEERIQMAVPMKPLCRAECRGLCAQCGTDLNVSECSCVVDEIDPRWRALQLLKKE